MKLIAIPMVLLTIASPVCAGEEPLKIPHGHKVTRIEVNAFLKGRPKVSMVLASAEELDFVVSHLCGLKARMYDHSMPQIDITVHFSNSESVRLRVSKSEVGPDAPASAWNLHWFPKDSALFDYLVSKAYPNSSAEAGQPNPAMHRLEGKLSITGSFLPNREAFEEPCSTLAQRINPPKPD